MENIFSTVLLYFIKQMQPLVNKILFPKTLQKNLTNPELLNSSICKALVGCFSFTILCLSSII